MKHRLFCSGKPDSDGEIDFIKIGHTKYGATGYFPQREVTISTTLDTTFSSYHFKPENWKQVDCMF